MILEMIVGVAALGACVSGWVMAFRSRGQANDAGDRARIAEARADAAVKKAELAQANEAGARSELKASEVALAGARDTIKREQKERDDDLERLAAAGIPVGDILVDGALGDLYPDGGQGGGEAGTGDGGQGGGQVPDDSGGAAGGTDPRG